MEIKQVTDNNFKNDWDDFIITNSSPSSFLQSWDWGNFKSNPIRFGFFENDELIAVAQFFKVGLPAGKFYLNCPKGPIILKHLSTEALKHILKLLKTEIDKITKKENLIFFRIAPKEKPNNDFIKPKILKNLVEPKNTLILNLENSEEEILKKMHQKTRYNIRLAERKNITIQQHDKTTGKQINEFYNLMQKTARRDKINIFEKEYYEKLLSESNVILLTAEFENEILSAIVLYTFGNTCTYFYGASSNEKRNLMPNYLIQWKAIKWAKQNGFKFYDFWGINPHGNTETQKHKNAWSGITKFKQGFVSEKTGKEINNIGAFDFVLNKKWYNIFRVGRIISLSFIRRG